MFITEHSSRQLREDTAQPHTQDTSAPPLATPRAAERGRPLALRAFSFGGGWQSMAVLILSARRELPYRHFIFANVGHDSEHPGTLDYIRHWVRPYIAAHPRLNFTELHRTRADGTPETLWGRLTRPGSRALPIPVRMSNGAPGTRSCTRDFKIEVIGRELKRRGATTRRPAGVGIGISVDEIHRANRRNAEPHEQIEYPLLDLGIRRHEIPAIISEAGLPVPPKSACFFCPLRGAQAWMGMRASEPNLFHKAAALERMLNARRRLLGRDEVYLSRYGIPLTQAFPGGVQHLPEDDPSEGCDSGWCMT